MAQSGPATCGDRIRDGASGPGDDDYKTRLQELAAQQFDQLPRYQIRAEGPDHSKRFFAAVTIAGVTRGEGEGRSKKHAEQAAARDAWHALAEAPAPDERVRVGSSVDRSPREER